MGGQVADHVPEANFYVGSPQGTEYKVRFFSYEVAEQFSETWPAENDDQGDQSDEMGENEVFVSSSDQPPAKKRKSTDDLASLRVLILD